MVHEMEGEAVEKRTPAEVIAYAKEQGIEFVDLRFCDLPGLMQHFSAPIHQLTEDVFTEGFGFDGSSIRGFQEIQESDMLLLPDPDTAVIDPFRTRKTLNLNCFVHDPLTGEAYSRDPRNIARKAEAYLVSTGLADTAFFGPEAEFFIFDSAHYGQTMNSAFYEVNSDAASWNAVNRENLDGSLNRGYKPRVKEGYFPVPPADHFQDLRSEMVSALEGAGVEIEIHHHEVATGGQAEIDMRFDTLLRVADKLMLYKYIVKNVAWQGGKTVTFMPKPLFQDNGSGMHTHQSLWKGGEPLFYDGDKYAGLSDMARWYIGGLLRHAPAVLAFAAPTTNSYKRLVPGYEAPVNLVYSQRNRSAAVRIPLYSKSPKAKRLEFRCPDPSCNPYLAFAAQMMAGLDGVQNRIEPPAPVDKDLYDLPPEELAKVPQVPGSLPESLDALEADHDFLLAGGVFTPDLIETWIEFKRINEIDAIRLRPHPYEFHLYFDI
jgi:glutamine synthetase